MIQDPLIRILLIPVSLLYGIGISIRDYLYRRKLLMSFRFNIPVISVGNLTVGGAGKSPHIEYLIRLLQPYINVATLSRGYGRKSVGYRAVEMHHQVEEVGDEPLMFKRKFPDVFVTVNEQRAMGIPQIIQFRPETQVILLDDAFQHRAVEPGLNILLTEFAHPFTRDYLLPSGRLREWRSAYFRADVIIVTKCPEDLSLEEKEKMTREIHPFPHQAVYFSSYRYLRPYYIFNAGYRIELQEDMTLLMVCAIANAEYMKEYLESRVETVRIRSFSDHHYFSDSDLEEINTMFFAMAGTRKLIVTTEKDAMRLLPHRSFIIEKKWPIVVLPLEVSFHFDDGPAFDNQVRQFLLNFRV